MNTIGETIVTVNAGSSSIKLAVFTVTPHTSQLSRLIDFSITNIGQPTSNLSITDPRTPSQDQVKEVHAPTHTAAAHILIEYVKRFINPDTVAAIGHRLVHGGMAYTECTPVSDISEADWHLLARLDSEHMPAAYEIIRQFVRSYPSVFQAACFDTAFFYDLPHVAKVIPLPKKYYDKGVRRYGFHGLSCASIMENFRERAGETAMQGRVIIAHLGSGASLTALQSGQPVDTTMGFTPTSGITMSTRSGDLDPHIFSYLHEQDNISIAAFERMVSFESGLLGVSGITSDMHTLLTQEKSNKDAAIAIELFVRDVKKSIGSLATMLRGIDSLIFAGGIGEQSAILRARICQGLEYMGIVIDDTANTQNSFLISAKRSNAGVHVIPTDEARIIATQTQELLIKKDRHHG